MYWLTIVTLVVLAIGLVAAIRYLTARRHDRAQNPGKTGELFSPRDPFRPS
jgi:hypothetical protein